MIPWPLAPLVFGASLVVPHEQDTRRPRLESTPDFGFRLSAWREVGAPACWFLLTGEMTSIPVNHLAPCGACVPEVRRQNTSNGGTAVVHEEERDARTGAEEHARKVADERARASADEIARRDAMELATKMAEEAYRRVFEEQFAVTYSEEFESQYRQAYRVEYGAAFAEAYSQRARTGSEDEPEAE